MDWKRLNRGLLGHEKKDGFIITENGYRFRLAYFRIVMILIVIVAALFFVSATAQGYGTDEIYLHCPEEYGQPCVNPFFMNCDHPDCASIADQEFVAPGLTIGKDPSVVADYVTALILVVIVSLFIAFWINHACYNRGKEFFQVEI